MPDQVLAHHLVVAVLILYLSAPTYTPAVHQSVHFIQLLYIYRTFSISLPLSCASTTLTHSLWLLGMTYIMCCSLLLYSFLVLCIHDLARRLLGSSSVCIVNASTIRGLIFCLELDLLKYCRQERRRIKRRCRHMARVGNSFLHTHRLFLSILLLVRVFDAL